MMDEEFPNKLKAMIFLIYYLTSCLILSVLPLDQERHQGSLRRALHRHHPNGGVLANE